MSLEDPLILLIGMPRSGTTWIGKIFDSHPDTLYRHEPDSIEAIAGLPLAPDSGRWRDYQPSILDFSRRLAAMRATKVAGSLPLFDKSYRRGLAAYGFRAGVFAAKLGARVFGEWTVPAFVRYARVPQLRVVWKSIESTGRVGVLVRSMPTRTILILRHPCGYVASVLRGEVRHQFGDSGASSEDYGILELLLETEPGRRSGLTMADLRAADPVERLAWRWRLFNDKALQETRGRDDVLVLRYEDLCAAPAMQAARLFEFSGLEWSEQTERFLAASTSTRRSGYYAVFKDPHAAAWGWRRELPVTAAEQVMAVAAGGAAGAIYTGGSGAVEAASAAPPCA